jgi:uncharacterized repeat protein (TIGR02543 family)
VAAVFALKGNGTLMQNFAYEDPPSSYTITLDNSNAPSALSETQFGTGYGYGRYVRFDYTAAKRATGYHILLDKTGTLYNDISTRISSLKTLTATFTGGEATLRKGPSFSTLGGAQVLTSGIEVELADNPYFFSLENTGTDTLYVTSLILTYSCAHVHSTIVFDADGGSAVAPITQSIGSAVSEPADPTKHGYLFDGWYTDEELTEGYSFTVMSDVDVVLYAKWNIDPEYPVLSIAQFKALNPLDVDHHCVNGVVILGKSEMNIIIIADETDTLIAFGYDDVEIGDDVRIGGYLSVEESLVVLVGDETAGVTADVYSQGNSIALDPTTITVAEYNLLNPDSPSSWVIYAEINGTINIDYNTHAITLTDGEDAMPVVVLGQEEYLYVSDYSQFRVNIRGVILPNMDEVPTTLMFLFNGHEDYIELDYTDAELLDSVETLIRQYYETPTFFPGQLVDLPANHPIASVTFVYVPFGDNAAKYDPLTNRVAADITVVIAIDVEVQVTLRGTINDSFNIKLHVDPSVIITIAEVIAKPDSNVDAYVIKCVVLNVQAQEDGDDMLLVADATGFIYINTDDEGVAVGDEVVAYGYRMTFSSMNYLMNDPSRTIDHIRAHNQGMPIDPVVITVANFLALDHEFVASGFVYYELVGTLEYQNPGAPESSGIMLRDGAEYVYIYPVSDAARAVLVNFIGQEVAICGLAILGGEPDNQIVFLAFLALSEIEVVE